MNSDNLTRIVKGMHDLLPEDLAKIEHVKSLFLKTAERYGFVRVQTPVLEFAEIYKSTSEFPEERCYSLIDGKSRKLILRSDPDAQLTRLVARHFRFAPKPVKLAFCDSIFRSWNPRRREFRMFSINTFGINEPTADAEILRIIADVVDEVGLPDYRVEFNNLQLFRCIISSSIRGSQSYGEVDNILYTIRFASGSESIITSLTSHHLPRGIIDAILELLECHDDESKAYGALVRMSSVFPSLIPELERTLAFRTALVDYGVRNAYFNIANLHGTGFYSGFTYRLFPKGGFKEIGDGGRYDHMMQRVYNEPMPAAGIGLGIERFIELMAANHCPITMPSKPRSMIIACSDSVLATHCRPALEQVRSAGLIIEEDLENRDFDKTVRYAKSKRYNRAVMIIWSESGSNFRLKIINLDKNCADSLVVANLEELRCILLEC